MIVIAGASRLQKNMEYLRASLKDLPLSQTSEFAVGGAVLVKLPSMTTLEKYTEAVAKQMLLYLGLPMLTPRVLVRQTSLSNEFEPAGWFSGDITKCNIQLNVISGCNLINVLAALAHECTHYFLRFHNCEYKDTQENEFLTDCAAVYLGFGYYMHFGYKPFSLSDEKQCRIGYIDVEDIEWIREWRRDNGAPDYITGEPIEYTYISSKAKPHRTNRRKQDQSQAPAGTASRKKRDWELPKSNRLAIGVIAGIVVVLVILAILLS